MREIYSFLVVIVYFFATIGCAGYLFLIHEPQFAIANLLLSAMAFPYVRSEWKKLNN